MKYVVIKRYSVIWNIMDITWTMIYAMIKLEVSVHLVANTALHMKHLTQWSPGMCMVTNGPCSSQKMIVNLEVKEQYSLMIIFYQRNIIFELRAKMASTAHVLMWLGAFVTYTLLMCQKLTQYQTHKHYIAGSLKPWSPSASWVRGISMGGPVALWTKDCNGFCDVSCGPLQRLAWLKAVAHNGTCSRPSDVAGKSFRENDFKIDYLKFYTTNIGGHWCLQSYFTSYCKKG